MSEPLIKLIYVMGYDFEEVELSAESGQAGYLMVSFFVDMYPDLYIQLSIKQME